MNPIGFNLFDNRSNQCGEEKQKTTMQTEIKPTIVQNFFPDCNRTLA